MISRLLSIPGGVLVLGCLLLTGCPAGGGNSDGSLDDSSDGGVAGPAEAAADEGGSGLSAARPDETFELNNFIFTDKCAATQADVCQRCESNQRIEVNECWSVCSDAQSAGIFQDCSRICGDLDDPSRCKSACDVVDEEACVERAYEFDVRGERDAKLEAACEDAVERDADCGEAHVGTACQVYAQVERPEARAAYECVADTECGGEANDCFADLGESNFSQEVTAACAEALSEDLMVKLDMQGSWLRESALEDVFICERLCGTGDYADCVQLWLEATFGD